MFVLERCPPYRESNKGNKEGQGTTLSVFFTETLWFFPMWRRNLRPSGWCGRLADSTWPQPFHRYLFQVGVLTSPLKWESEETLLRRYSYLILFLVIVGKLKPSQPPTPQSLDFWVQNYFCLSKIAAVHHGHLRFAHDHKRGFSTWRLLIVREVDAVSLYFLGFSASLMSWSRWKINIIV